MEPNGIPRTSLGAIAQRRRALETGERRRIGGFLLERPKLQLIARI
jgi:hypothetical protein